MLVTYNAMSNKLRVNVLNGFHYQMPQFQVFSAYIKRAMAKNVKNGSTHPASLYLNVKYLNTASTCSKTDSLS